MHIQHTKQWIRSFVISLNLCPFAKREMDQDSVKILASPSITIESALTDFMIEIECLNLDKSIETTLLLFPHFLHDFFDYLDFIHLANTALSKTGYKSIYQLATFHPNYQFHGTHADDVTNYTNRSPYPMLHILREDSLERAIAYYGDTEAIPEKNIILLKNIGLNEVKKRLRDNMES